MLQYTQRRRFFPLRAEHRREIQIGQLGQYVDDETAVVGDGVDGVAVQGQSAQTSQVPQDTEGGQVVDLVAVQVQDFEVEKL